MKNISWRHIKKSICLDLCLTGRRCGVVAGWPKETLSQFIFHIFCWSLLFTKYCCLGPTEALNFIFELDCFTLRRPVQLVVRLNQKSCLPFCLLAQQKERTTSRGVDGPICVVHLGNRLSQGRQAVVGSDDCFQ